MRYPRLSLGLGQSLLLGLLVVSTVRTAAQVYPESTPAYQLGTSVPTITQALAESPQKGYTPIFRDSTPSSPGQWVPWGTNLNIQLCQFTSPPFAVEQPDPGYQITGEPGAPSMLEANPPLANSPVNSPQLPAVIPVAGPNENNPPNNLSPAHSDGSTSAPAHGVTMEEVREEARKWAWTKGDFKIVPYGILWFNMAYETQRTAPGDYTLYVYSPDVRDYDNFHLDARATRLGLDVTGPKVPFFCDAPSSGKVEIDFFSPVQVSENRATVMLRHAYWEVKNEYFRLLGGQTWDLHAPLLPGTLMYSVGWSVGNLGYRRAQLRYERYFPVSPVLQFAMQVAMASDLADDAPGLNGDQEGWPVLEMRTAVTLGERGQGKRPTTLGFSGHIGEQFYERDPASDLDDGTEKTWSFAVDLHMPLSERMGVQGEFFTGANLGHFLGGIAQGINPTTGQAIRSTGGWFEIWYDWTKRLHSHVGYGIDDPINRDVHVGGRVYNDFIFANLIYDLTERFQAGLEYTHWKTHYQARAPGESDRIEFAAKYNF